MTENRPSGHPIATSLSRTGAAFLVAALAAVLPGSSAHAQATPPASSPSSLEPRGTITMLPAPDAFQARNQVGVQIGSTGIFQFVYRLRAFGPLHLEAGAMGADHVANFSAGVLVGVPLVRRWFPYVGFGGGVMWGFGPKTADGCDPSATMCPLVTDSDSLAFLYARVGLGVAFGDQRRHLVSVDVGGWRGNHVSHRSDPTGVDLETTTRVIMPMAGASYFYPF